VTQITGGGRAAAGGGQWWTAGGGAGDSRRWLGGFSICVHLSLCLSLFANGLNETRFSGFIRLGIASQVFLKKKLRQRNF